MNAPDWLWLAYDDTMLPPVDEIAKKRRVTAIINPSDGPAPSSSFAAAVKRWRRLSNVSIKGYIDAALWTKDGKLKSIKAATDIAREMSQYASLFGITEDDGFWIDDAFADNAKIKAALMGVRWRKPAATILNPGEPLNGDHWMRKAGFLICDHEDPLPAKSRGGGAWIVFAKPGELGSIVSLASARGVKLLGIEDLARHHNGEFQRPPSMWKQMM